MRFFGAVVCALGFAAVLGLDDAAAQSANADAPDVTLAPTYGTIDWRTGFGPDPYVVRVAAGGSIDASAGVNAQCRGGIARAPDYRVNYVHMGNLPLIISVASEADTTLVINDAQGNWLCDDDGGSEGLNPAITFTNPPSGQYDIWVGTYAPGDLQDSTLHISELYAQ